MRRVPVGPPQSVAIAPNETSFALVTAATKLDPTDKKKVVPHNIVSVIDLKATPPEVIATHETGLGASGVAINRNATLVLVANRNEGSVSVFTVAGKTLTSAGKITLGDTKSGPSSVAFTPDGKMALVTRDGDSRVSVLTVNGNTVEPAKRDIYAGLRPYPLGISPRGDFAAITNAGGGNGDADTISLIVETGGGVSVLYLSDLLAVPPRVVDTVSVGQTPESLTVAPDGKHVVVTVMKRLKQAARITVPERQRYCAGLRRGGHEVPQGGGDQRWSVVSGCGLEQGYDPAAGPVICMGHRLGSARGRGLGQHRIAVRSRPPVLDHFAGPRYARSPQAVLGNGRWLMASSDYRCRLAHQHASTQSCGH